MREGNGHRIVPLVVAFCLLGLSACTTTAGAERSLNAKWQGKPVTEFQVANNNISRSREDMRDGTLLYRYQIIETGRGFSAVHLVRTLPSWCVMHIVTGAADGLIRDIESVDDVRRGELLQSKGSVAGERGGGVSGCSPEPLGDCVHDRGDTGRGVMKYRGSGAEASSHRERDPPWQGLATYRAANTGSFCQLSL